MVVPVKLFVFFDFKSMVSIRFLNPCLFFGILSGAHLHLGRHALTQGVH